MARGCDALIVVTPWNEFKQLDMKVVKNLMNSPVIFDSRNLYPPAEMKALGFQYKSIGRSGDVI
jgi:UDPglucose 6-dehydrogenase